MKIYRGKKIISESAESIDNVLKQFLGLRFSKQKELIFNLKRERNIMMDMFFVFYPIDIVFLNKDKNIIELKQRFKPFSIYASKKQSKYVIELKQGLIKKNNLKIGDKLHF